MMCSGSLAIQKCILAIIKLLVLVKALLPVQKVVLLSQVVVVLDIMHMVKSKVTRLGTRLVLGDIHIGDLGQRYIDITEVPQAKTVNIIQM